VKKALNQAEKEFTRLKRDIKAQEQPIEKVSADFRKSQTELRSSLPEAPKIFEPMGEVRPGDRVVVAALGREGTVMTVNPAKAVAEVDLDGMMVRAPVRDLGRPGPRRKKEKRALFTMPAVGETPRELNILGLTVDEALPEVEKTLDKAQLGGVKKLSIIHGIGTGRLREAVREYLSESALVKDYHPGDGRAGGEGVTVVELSE
jgi:DNA mismatch repair protein MutS2